jgi:predicted ATPase
VIESVKLEYFKAFKEQEFPLKERIVTVGPNDTGKSTLLQAIAVWDLALKKWLELKGTVDTSSKKGKTAIPITRKEFTAIPLREMKLLWTECSTHLGKEKAGYPRLIRISLRGSEKEGRAWELAFEFRYSSKEVVYVKPAAEHLNAIPYVREHIGIVHVPPFSGIGAEEPVHTRPYQDYVVGQGKPGDILRNLILEIHEHKNRRKWEDFVSKVREMFHYQLLPPKAAGRAFILCEYKDVKRNTKLDISCAGSGFLQTLTLFAFLYARPSTVLLLDEPDAHLHVILQKQIYDQLKRVASETNSQLIIATHSEVLVEATPSEQVLSFFKSPHILVGEPERDQVREALKRITNMDILLAEQTPGILYLEGSTDLDLLREWARILNHSAYNFLQERPFWHSMGGRNPREAKGHFFALKMIKEKAKGYILLDGDNRGISDQEVATEGLLIGRWTRYEAENYLLHPQALLRFFEQYPQKLFITPNPAMDYFKEELPAVYKDPLGNHPVLEGLAASKQFLPEFFKRAQVSLSKSDYYRIASLMRPEEVHPEIKQKLDDICKAFGIKP